MRTIGEMKSSVTMWNMSLRLQRPRQILDQVVGMFQADGEAQQILGRARLWPLDGSAMLDQALRPAQAGRAREERRARRHRHRPLAVAAHLEREHAAWQ